MAHPIIRVGVLLGVLGAVSAVRAEAAALPPSCASVKAPADTSTAIPVLRKRVEAANESDPMAAFALMCTTIPRVERRYGAHSNELAWWTASLATPLIAYMDKFDEALPVLEFARPILERRYGRYGEPLGDIHVAYAWIYFRQGRLAESGTEWSEALEVRERHPGHRKIELQKVLVGLAQVQLSQREFAGAQQNLDRAHEILVENHDTVSEAGAAIESALAAVEFRRERYEEARRHAEETLRIENQLKGGAAQLVPAYALLGRILERLDEYEQAEAALRHAVALSEGSQGPLQRHHFSALYQLAALLEERNHPAEARTQALRALEIGQDALGPAAPRLVPVLQVLGDAEHQLGELSHALRHFEQAGAIIAGHASDVERSWLVDYYRDLGSLQANLGDTAAAAGTLTTGLAAAGDDATLAVERAWLLIDHAHIGENLGRPVRDELKEAVTLLRSRLPETHPAILRALDELCELELGTPKDAPDCVETTNGFDRSADAAPDVAAAVDVTLSRWAAASANSAAARDFAVRAVAAAESAAEPERLWLAYSQLSAVLRADHETPLAVFFGKQALIQLQRERGQLIGNDRHFEAGFLRDKVDTYRRVADWLLELGRTDEGLSVLQLMKSEEFQDFGIREAAATGSDVPLTPWEQTFGDRYGGMVRADADAAGELSKLTRLDETDKISPAERSRLGQLVADKGSVERERAARLDALLQGTKATDRADAHAERELATPALRRLAGGAVNDAAFAVYLLADEHLRILMTASGVERELRIPLDGPQLQRDIGHLLDDISQHHEAAGLSRRLYDLIARPVDDFAAKQHVQRLVLWLDGSLRYLPVAALTDGRRFLGDKYVIQIYTPTPPDPPAHDGQSVGAGLRREPALVRGFGVTQAFTGFSALPAVADELCYVVDGPITGLRTASAACPTPSSGHGALTGDGFADAAFTEQRFKESLAAPRNFSVLHIGTHFRLRPGNALRSYLLLGDGSHLSLDEIGAMDFEGIDVVTLSACETGMGGAVSDDGREVEGLGALVQRRGAGLVIASLWQVDDASTAQFMRALYRNFRASHGDAAFGLQQAQRALRASAAYADPYYWAGFIVYGNRAR
jgi:CHAT domain-containing protein